MGTMMQYRARLGAFGRAALIGSLGLGWPGTAIAQTPPAEFLPLEAPAEPLPAENRPEPNSSPLPPSLTPPSHHPTSPATAPQTVALTLADLITLTLAGNRALQNEGLARIIQRQELNAAEQAFDPRFTPLLEANVTRRLSEDGLEVTDPSTGEILFGTSPTSRSSRTVLETVVTTRQGTDIRVEVDPINGDRLLNFRLSQPLLRGFGTAVNEAPVNQARLGETRNQLALQTTVIDLITLATTRYTSLISAQAQVEIQAQALGRRQRQLEILQALVGAGRRAPIDVFDTERTVAEAERSLVEAQNALTQANNDLLNLIGTDQALQFVAAPVVVDELFEAAIAQAATYQAEALVQLALEQRRDYRQAQLERQQLELGQLIAEDALRWQVNAVADGNVGDFSRTTLGLVATRTFDDPQLETDRVRSNVSLQQQDNNLAQLQEQIRNDVIARLANVQSTQFQVEAAERATLSAQSQLDALKEQYRVGRGSISLSEIIIQEENLVEAQTNRLNARIAFLNSMAELDQTVGITLERWAVQVEESAFGPELSP